VEQAGQYGRCLDCTEEIAQPPTSIYCGIEKLGRQITAETPETNKPDFRNGFPIRDLRDGSMIPGQADGEELVLGRRGDEFFAIGAHCTHFGGPLAEGLIVGDTVRCPWHHA
jgi:Rieske Fe-S protein